MTAPGVESVIVRVWVPVYVPVASYRTGVLVVGSVANAELLAVNERAKPIRATIGRGIRRRRRFELRTAGETL